jgi:hypothetical protein
MLFQVWKHRERISTERLFVRCNDVGAFRYLEQFQMDDRPNTEDSMYILLLKYLLNDLGFFVSHKIVTFNFFIQKSTLLNKKK